MGALPSEHGILHGVISFRFDIVYQRNETK